MREIDASADQIVSALLRFSEGRNIAVLDSCSVGKAGSNLLIVGIDPVDVVGLSDDDPGESLTRFEAHLDSDSLAAVFTLSYELGTKLNDIPSRNSPAEPEIFVALFDCLIIHDYDLKRSFLAGCEEKFDAVEVLLAQSRTLVGLPRTGFHSVIRAGSNFTRARYIQAVQEIKELIRSGETYQTNLTQQFEIRLHSPPQDVFLNLRRDNPAPFAALIDRGDSVVVSASPEQFLRIDTFEGDRTITASPIKGTRPRGASGPEDRLLRDELLTSQKDRAENIMIVDLMRNDLGRVCQFGSVQVEELCRLEEHPTLFHLVSTVTGSLRGDARLSDVIRAMFPCGSITGAPKVRTMQVIDILEPDPRGLSMGAIGCRIPRSGFGMNEFVEMSVGIRTMVIREGKAVFNVGGGIVIDSDPAAEYAESMLKAKALLRALGAQWTDDEELFRGAGVKLPKS